MAYGALAVAETEPDLARRTIERAVEKVRIPMRHYAPDGAYPEGYAYWEYGTSFNVLLISAMENAFGTDFGLCDAPPVFWNPGNSYAAHGHSAVALVLLFRLQRRRRIAPRLCFGLPKNGDASILCNQGRLLQADSRKITCRIGCSRCCSSGGRSVARQTDRAGNPILKGGGDNPFS